MPSVSCTPSTSESTSEPNGRKTVPSLYVTHTNQHIPSDSRHPCSPCPTARPKRPSKSVWRPKPTSRPRRSFPHPRASTEYVWGRPLLCAELTSRATMTSRRKSPETSNPSPKASTTSHTAPTSTSPQLTVAKQRPLRSSHRLCSLPCQGATKTVGLEMRIEDCLCLSGCQMSIGMVRCTYGLFCRSFVCHLA